MPTPQLNFARRALLAAIAKHPPSGKQAYLRDATTRSLVLEYTPAGRMTFQFYGKLHGRPQRVALGRFDASLPDVRRLPDVALCDPLTYIATRPSLSVTAARSLCAAVRSELEQGRSAKDRAAALRNDPSVGNLLDAYEAHLQTHARQRSRASAQYSRKHLRPLESSRASSLSPAAVVALHRKIGAAAGPIAANRTVETLRAALRLRCGRHAQLPTDDVRMFPSVERERVLSPAERARLHAVLVREPEDVRGVIELLLHTGVRKSALRLATVADVDLERARFVVPVERSKSGAPYAVPLLPEAMKILSRRVGAVTTAARAAGPSVSVATTRLFDLSDSGLTRAWARIRAAADIPDVTLHDLRRSFGAGLASSGASLLVVAKALGHTSTSATKVYARIADDAVRAAMEQAAAATPPGNVVRIPRRRA